MNSCVEPDSSQSTDGGRIRNRDKAASLTKAWQKYGKLLRFFNARERNSILDNSAPDWSCGILFLRMERALSANLMQPLREDRKTVMNLFAICGRFCLSFFTILWSIKCRMNVRNSHRFGGGLSKSVTLRCCHREKQSSGQKDQAVVENAIVLIQRWLASEFGSDFRGLEMAECVISSQACVYYLVHSTTFAQCAGYTRLTSMRLSSDRLSSDH